MLGSFKALPYIAQKIPSHGHKDHRTALLVGLRRAGRAKRRTMGAKTHSPVTTDRPPPSSLPNDHPGPTTLTVLCCFRRLIKEAGSAMNHQTKTGRALQPRRPTCPQTEVSLPGPGPETYYGGQKAHLQGLDSASVVNTGAPENSAALFHPMYIALETVARVAFHF